MPKKASVPTFAITSQVPSARQLHKAMSKPRIGVSRIELSNIPSIWHKSTSLMRWLHTILVKKLRSNRWQWWYRGNTDNCTKPLPNVGIARVTHPMQSLLKRFHMAFETSIHAGQGKYAKSEHRHACETWEDKKMTCCDCHCCCCCCYRYVPHTANQQGDHPKSQPTRPTSTLRTIHHQGI